MSLIIYLVPILLVTIVFLYNLVKLIRSNSKLPPGPRKFPIIGSMLSMMSLSSELPYEAFRTLAKTYGPLLHLQLGEISTVVVSSDKMAKEILVKHDLNFASRPELLVTKHVFYDSTDLAFSPYGSYWRQMRKICTLELLSAKKVKSFASIREGEVSMLLESISKSSSEGSVVNLSKHVFSLMNTIISKAAFGMIYKDQERLLDMLQEMSNLGKGFDIADIFPSYKFLHVLSGMEGKLQKLHKNLDDTLNSIIEDHNKTAATKIGTNDEDFLDILLRCKESSDLEFPITLDNIKAVILDVFGAGTDTSAGTVEWAMSEMIKNPRILKKAQDEVRQVLNGKKTVQEADIQDIKYLKLVIKEAMRLHPTVPMLLPRECRETCEIAGYTIPAKTQVIINAWALQRDPEYWQDAELFSPERFENSSYDFKGGNLEYLPFGAGRRICPGMLFGVASVELVLSSLLYHFDWELPGGVKGEDLDMEELFGGTVRRKSHLEVIAKPYSQL